MIYFKCSQIWQLLLLIDAFAGQTATACIGDFGRCTCMEDPVTTAADVFCLGIPFNEVKATFAANNGLLAINRLNLVPLIGDTQIPANLLGSKRVRVIHLASCGDGYAIQIDPTAFNSSSGYTEEFLIYECEVSKLTWAFLRGFTNISKLHLEAASKIESVVNLPSLPSVRDLEIVNSKGFTQSMATEFPGRSLNGLRNLVLTENAELDDAAITSILTTFTGAKSLELLSLNNSPLISKIPDNIKVLPGLNSLDVSMCAAVTSVSNNSLVFSSPAVKLVDLTSTSLTSISNNAFENGDSFIDLLFYYF